MTENQVKITYSDNNPNYLSPKLQGGNNIVLTDNGNFIRIDAITSPGDHSVLVDGNDTSPGFLGSKLEAGSGVSLVNTGSTIKINANTQSGDHKVIVDSNDTSPGYLLSKLTAGQNVTLTNNGTSIEISSIDTGMLNPMTTLGDIIVGGVDGAPDRLGIGTDGYVLTASSGSPTWAAIPTQTGDHKVLVDSSDTNPQYLGVKLKSGVGINISYYNHDKMEIASLGQVKVALLGTIGYLGDKILQGSGITLTKTNNDITIAANTQPGDHKVIASSGDTTPDYLGNKLVQGTGITLTKGTSDITIAADTQTGDHKVIIDSNDTSPGYLASKLTAGTNITITNNGTDLEISSIDTGMLNPMNALGDIIIGGASGDPARLGIGSEGYVLTVSSGSPAWTAIPTQTGDHKVIIDGNDTSPGYLASKLTAGSNVTITNNGTDLEISSTDTGFANPMTTAGDLIIGGSSGTPTRFAKGYQGQVLKVGSSSLEWAADIGFANPMEELGDLIVGTYDGVASRLPIGTVNQFLYSNGTTAEWATLPLNIDWVLPPALANGEFNQSIDRTFYVRVYPSLQMRAINHVAILLSGAVAADVLRAAVYDNTRTMVAYGESTSSSSTFRRITLTQLQPWTPGTNDLYYLGVSIHASSNSSTKIKTASVTSPSYCWYEDVALTSGRAMPAPSSLTASTSKVPIIGLRGR